MLSPAAKAGAPGIYTPAVGSAERAAILKTLHEGEDKPQWRFMFRQFRILHKGPRAIAYVQGEGPVGNFQAILTLTGGGGWRRVWGESDGGSNSCGDGVRHFAWALRLTQGYTADPDALFPGLASRIRELRRMATLDPDMQCVGDLDGGPG
jgi:hypothetical protein